MLQSMSSLLLLAVLPMASGFVAAPLKTVSPRPPVSALQQISFASSSLLGSRTSDGIGTHKVHKGHASPRRHAGSMTRMMGDDASVAKGFTCDQVEEAANQCGMTMSINFLGPYYRAVIRQLPAEGEEKGKAVGFTTGTMVGDLLRQDTMRVSSVNTGNELSRDRIKRLKAERDWRVPTVYGISLILGAYVGAYAFQKGCKNAELLAIKDDERQHKILVRHYRRLGLEVVKVVDDDISCTGDRLIWGGVGALMRCDIEKFIVKHADGLRAIAAKSTY